MCVGGGGWWNGGGGGGAKAYSDTDRGSETSKKANRKMRTLAPGVW